MESIAGLLQAIATLAWPTFAFIVLFLFKEEIRQLLKRVRSGKVLGAEFELGEDIKELKADANAAASEVAALPAQTVEAQLPGTVDNTLAEIAKTLLFDPPATLLVLAASIEEEIDRIVETSGRVENGQKIGITSKLKILTGRLREHGVSANVAVLVFRFWELRNRLARGGKAETEYIIEMINAGTAILRTLAQIPSVTQLSDNPVAD